MLGNANSKQYFRISVSTRVSSFLPCCRRQLSAEIPSGSLAFPANQLQTEVPAPLAICIFICFRMEAFLTCKIFGIRCIIRCGPFLEIIRKATGITFLRCSLVGG